MMWRGWMTVMLMVGLATVRAWGAQGEALTGVDRIVFLGDSNTYAGLYVEYVEAVFRARASGRKIEVINLSLPSETASGLSEPDHPFPRPCVHERLDRVLAKTKPGLVVACYGMNDGIYYPLSTDRMKAYGEGMTKLVEKVRASGAKIVLLTPPPFDVAPVKDKTLPAGQEKYSWMRPFVGYDQVLAAYSLWLKGQEREGWTVVDIREPMIESASARRAAMPGYALAADGIHFNAMGHWLVAKEVLVELGVSEDLVDGIGFQSAEAGKESIAFPDVLGEMPLESALLVKLIHERQSMMRDAWLSEVGHKRPDMSKGLPMAEAKKKELEVEKKISEVLTAARQAKAQSAKTNK